MSHVNVTLPSLGDDAGDKATVSVFFRDPGDEIKEGDDLVEMVTDKATFNVPSPAAGVLKRILVKEDQKVQVGRPLAVIETG